MDSFTGSNGMNLFGRRRENRKRIHDITDEEEEEEITLKKAAHILRKRQRLALQSPDTSIRTTSGSSKIQHDNILEKVWDPNSIFAQPQQQLRLEYDGVGTFPADIRFPSTTTATVNDNTTFTNIDAITTPSGLRFKSGNASSHQQSKFVHGIGKPIPDASTTSSYQGESSLAHLQWAQGVSPNFDMSLDAATGSMVPALLNPDGFTDFPIWNDLNNGSSLNLAIDFPNAVDRGAFGTNTTAAAMVECPVGRGMQTKDINISDPLIGPLACVAGEGSKRPTPPNKPQLKPLSYHPEALINGLNYTNEQISQYADFAALRYSIEESLDSGGCRPSLDTPNASDAPLQEPHDGTSGKENLPLPSSSAGAESRESIPTRCVRCRMQKLRCERDERDPMGSCKNCTKLKDSKGRIHRQPCLRYIISKSELIDHAHCPRPSWSLRWKEMKVVNIRSWQSKCIKTILVTQDVSGTPYSLKVRKFIPTEGDAMERRWKTNGVEEIFKCTPYAIADMNHAAQTLSSYVDSTLPDAICYYIDETDPLLYDTYWMAYRYSKCAELSEEERELLRAVLRLWNASRMESRSDRICSDDETLGMEPQFYASNCANSGHILLPPVMSAQIEVIMTVEILQKAKKNVLKLLNTLIGQSQHRSWFTIYLAMFILLHNTALLTDSDMKKAKKQGLSVQFFRKPLMENLHKGAKNLLTHFHYCNEIVQTFSTDLSSLDDIARVGLNKEQALFIQKTLAEVEKKSDLFRTVREQCLYEHQYYFVSQLYDREWNPAHVGLDVL